MKIREEKTFLKIFFLYSKNLEKIQLEVNFSVVWCRGRGEFGKDVLLWTFNSSASKAMRILSKWVRKIQKKNINSNSIKSKEFYFSLSQFNRSTTLKILPKWRLKTLTSPVLGFYSTSSSFWFKKYKISIQSNLIPHHPFSSQLQSKFY